MKSRKKRSEKKGKKRQGEEKRKGIRRKILKCWMWEQTIFTFFLWYRAARVSFPCSQPRGALLLAERTRLAGELGSKAVTSINICCRRRQWQPRSLEKVHRAPPDSWDSSALEGRGQHSTVWLQNTATSDSNKNFQTIPGRWGCLLLTGEFLLTFQQYKYVFTHLKPCASCLESQSNAPGFVQCWIDALQRF